MQVSGWRTFSGVVFYLVGDFNVIGGLGPGKPYFDTSVYAQPTAGFFCYSIAPFFAAYSF